MLSSDPSFKPQDTKVKTEVPLGPGGPGSPAPTPATPSSTTTIPTQKPVTTPVAPSKVQTAPPTSTTSTSTAPTPPPPPPTPTQDPPTPPKRRFRGLRALLYLLLFSGLIYGSAIFYALRSDNFHDFFTEYIPFGEDAVLFFEERSFKRRFPNSRQDLLRSRQSKTDSESNVTIPWKSGLSWKVSDDGPQGGSDVSQKGKHMSALGATQPKVGKPEVKDAHQDPTGASRKENVKAVEQAKKGSPTPKQTDATKKESPPPAPAAKEMPQPSPATPSPKSDSRPPAVSPVTQISNLSVPNAEEPVVQDLVKVMNDLITVVNSDNADAANKYSQPMNKAKEELVQIASKITALRDAERKAGEERVQQAHKEFDDGARQLLQRIETSQAEDAAKFREEFESERTKLAQNYDERLKSEIQHSQDLSEQRLRNELTEQAIKLKQNFVTEIQSLVEAEREGRLSKLSDLSTNVDSLSELTTNWNGVIDSNLATQKLQVAVDSVRSALARSSFNEIKPQPFVREMAALKLVADGDAIVDAAIASVNPSAYQRGIPSNPQLIDRFRGVAGEVRKASLLPEDAGVASHAASFLLSKVMFKKAGQPTGSDVESILTRTETLLEEGDLDAAAREMNGLQGWAKVLSRDWLVDVRRVLEVRQALDVCETEARLQCLRVE